MLSTFHYALNVPGFLVLGTAESASGTGDYFALLDRKHKIYSKNPVVSHPPTFLPKQEDTALIGSTPSTSSQNRLAADYQVRADRLLLAEYAPPGVLINETFDILQFRGDTRPFCRTRRGNRPSIYLD